MRPRLLSAIGGSRALAEVEIIYDVYYAHVDMPFGAT